MKMKTMRYICSRCEGSGLDERHKKCPVCDGTGWIKYRTLPYR